MTNKYASEKGYKCLQCAPGCDTCVDSSPCILALNWVQRSIVLGLSCFVMAFIPMLVWFTFRYSQVKVRGRPLMIWGAGGGPEENSEMNLFFPRNNLSKFFSPAEGRFTIFFPRRGLFNFFPFGRPFKNFFSWGWL